MSLYFQLPPRKLNNRQVSSNAASSYHKKRCQETTNMMERRCIHKWSIYTAAKCGEKAEKIPIDLHHHDQIADEDMFRQYSLPRVIRNQRQCTNLVLSSEYDMMIGIPHDATDTAWSYEDDNESLFLCLSMWKFNNHQISNDVVLSQHRRKY